jgi:thiol-disulfide isomerase/thioredoxin
MNVGLWKILALAAAAVSVCGCDSPPHSDAPPGIAWFDDVEAAFAQAHSDGKPVFLYWGAAWCPYCADLEAHVFARRDVQEKLKLFVAVYLDGDDAGAQKWAEEFAIVGYPTVLALDPDRAELARIAGGMDVAVYADMLDLVLGDVRPLRTVLASLEGDSADFTRDDCRRLAYDGWGLRDAPAFGMAAPLARAAERCPADAHVERARLSAIAAAYAVDEQSQAIAAGAAPNALLVGLVGAVRDIVADRELGVASADALQYLGADFFAVARTLEPEKAAELRDRWSAVMQAAAADPRYTEGDRLAAVRSEIVAVKALTAEGEVPAELAAAAYAHIDAALARGAGTPAERGAVNATVNLLVALDDLERAYAVAEKAMDGAKTPYYHMADLAALDERMGRTDAAIAWLERAYRESSGPATRFQWGTSYVRGLIRMQPTDTDAVRDAAIAVLGELDGPDRIYRRSRERLESLDHDLRAWNAQGGYAEAVGAIRNRMDAICATIPGDQPDALASCRSFLN